MLGRGDGGYGRAGGRGSRWRDGDGNERFLWYTLRLYGYNGVHQYTTDGRKDCCFLRRVWIIRYLSFNWTAGKEMESVRELELSYRVLRDVALELTCNTLLHVACMGTLAATGR
jgi:hypothetical protein